MYLAEDPELDRRVALKVLPRDLIDHPERRAWFRREATSAAALNHPNICTIFDIGEADGRLFIAMEAIEGRTLSARLADGPLSLAEILAIAIQVADALDEARHRQIVHRDLKSLNIMLTSKGQVKVLDFGLAKRLDTPPSAGGETETMATQGSAGFGTLAYMSPEQVLGRAVDHRSDLFSFGVVLYEMAVGRRPFKAETQGQLLDSILHQTPTSPSIVNSLMPAAFGDLVMKLLQKDPEQRYQSAHDVLKDLRAIKDGRAIRSRPRRGRLVPAAIAVGATVAAAALAGAGWWAARATPPVTDTRPVVVVPATVNGAPEFRYLTEAVASSITTRLSERGDLRVKVPPTAAEFERIGGDLARIAESYGVRACVVPRVTVSGDRMMLTVQIIDPASREILWTEEYQTSLAGYVGLTTRVAADIAGALGASATTARSPVSPPSSNVELALRRGDYYANQFNLKYRPEDFDAAQRAYQEALAINPNEAAAPAGMAILYLYRMQGGLAPELALPLVDSSARHSLQLDPRNGMAWTALAHGDLWRPRPDLAKQLEYGFQAAAFGETCSRCQAGLIPGLFQVSLVMVHRVSVAQAEIDPLYAYTWLNSALGLGALGRAAEAKRSLAKAATLEPAAPWVITHEGFVQAQAGSMREALASFERLKGREGAEKLPPWALRLIGYIQTLGRGDDQNSTDRLNQMRASIRAKTATAIEVQYVTDVVVPMLAAARNPAAIGLLDDLGSAGSPAPLDMLRLNPHLERVLAEPAGQAIVAASLERFAYLRRAVDTARKAGRLAPYLEDAIRELNRSVPGAGL